MNFILFYLFGPWFWLALAVFFALIELFTQGLTTIWFTAAAVVLLFVSMAPVPAAAQLVIFVALSALFLIFTLPIAVKKLKLGKEKTNIDSLVGRSAPVVKKIGKFERGEIKLNGQIWSALEENDRELEPGTECEVVRIEGAHAVVRGLEPAPEKSSP